MTLIDLENQTYRREILGLLEQDPDYAINDGIIQSGLALRGYHVSHDRLTAQLHWLREQGLITLNQLPGVLVAKLTRRGEDVALCRAAEPGVARQRPD